MTNPPNLPKPDGAHPYDRAEPSRFETARNRDLRPCRAEPHDFRSNA